MAGAGTGKTRVITHRIADLTKSGVHPSEILAVTFTNKAAKEMKTRLKKMGVDIESLWIGTFHSIGARVLRMHAPRVGYERNFTIYDEDDQKQLFRAICGELGTDDKGLSHGMCKSFVTYAKECGYGPSEIHKTAVPEKFLMLVQEVYEKYTKALRASNAMDFADLLLYTIDVLNGGGSAASLTTRFKHVLVDEFQDTNRLQISLVELFGSEAQICVVGDDDQSIYSWRGADPRCMIDFSDRWHVKVVKLEENYRCTQHILDCANTLIKRNVERLGKTLRTRKVGDKVKLKGVSNERTEADYVAINVKQPWSSNAVLYRTHRQSRAIEEGMRKYGIPYKIIGGLRFYDRAEIKDMMSYMHLAMNPRSDLNLIRIANRPARGIGAKAVGQLKSKAIEDGISMFDALKEIEHKKLANLRHILIDIMKARQQPLLDFYKFIIERTGYREALVRTSAESSSKDQQEKAQTKVENVDELGSDIASYVSMYPDGDLERYLEHVSLMSSNDEETEDHVSLMTIHAAKGLEFPQVFLVGFEEGLLPHINSIRAFEVDRDPNHIEEERRLAYVAITRAMDNLHITVTHVRSIMGRLEASVDSRFLDDLPRENIEPDGIRFG